MHDRVGTSSRDCWSVFLNEWSRRGDWICKVFCHDDDHIVMELVYRLVGQPIKRNARHPLPSWGSDSEALFCGRGKVASGIRAWLTSHRSSQAIKASVDNEA